MISGIVCFLCFVVGMAVGVILAAVAAGSWKDGGKK